MQEKRRFLITFFQKLVAFFGRKILVSQKKAVILQPILKMEWDYGISSTISVFEAKTPTFDIVQLNAEQWREFFWLERSMMRMEWMIHFLNREYMRHEIKELWWIPLDDQDQLKIDNL